MDDSVRELLKEWNFEDYIEKFKNEKVDHEAFKNLNEDDLKVFFPEIGPRSKFRVRLLEYQTQDQLGFFNYISHLVRRTWSYWRQAPQHEVLPEPQASSSRGAAGITPPDDEAGRKSNDVGGVRYTAQAGTGDGAEKGAKYEKDIPTMIFLRGVGIGHTFHLGSNVGEVHPHDDVFYIHKMKDSDEWIAVLCQLKYKGGVLTKSNVVKTYDGNNDAFNCLKYARLSIQKKKKMDDFIEDCIKDAGGVKTDDGIENYTKKYILFTNAVVQPDLKNTLVSCDDLDELLKTGDDSEAHSFKVNGFKDIIDQYIENKKEEIKELKEYLNILKGHLKTNPLNGNESYSRAQNHNQNGLKHKNCEERNKLQIEINRLENKLKQLESEKDLTPEEVKDYLKHFILCSNQLSPNLEDEGNCELSALLKKEVRTTLKVDLSDRDPENKDPIYGIQENKVLDHFKSTIQSKLNNHFKSTVQSKLNNKTREYETITDKANFLEPMKGAVDALNTSTTTIQHWNQVEFNDPLETADHKTRSMQTKIETSWIQYHINNDSVAWTTLKVINGSRAEKMIDCTVNNMTDLIENINSIIAVLEVPCYRRGQTGQVTKI